MNEQPQPTEPPVVRRRGRPPKNLPVLADPHPNISAPTTNPQEQPPAPVLYKQTALSVHDVVQVINSGSHYYGVLFQIGDIRGSCIHGFHMMSGGRREYVTVNIDECHPVGVSKVRSREPVSPQWEAEINPPKK